MTHSKEYYERIIKEAQAGIAALEDKSWPKYGDQYFYTASIGVILEECWSHSPYDLDRKVLGSIFKSVQDAAEYVKWRKLHTALMKASDGWSSDGVNYSPSYVNNKISTTDWSWTRSTIPYFKTHSRAIAISTSILGSDAEFYFTYDQFKGQRL